MSAAGARAQLAMLLANCSDAALAGFGAAELARMYRVPAKEIEYALIIERQRRARRA